MKYRLIFSQVLQKNKLNHRVAKELYTSSFTSPRYRTSFSFLSVNIYQKSKWKLETVLVARQRGLYGRPCSGPDYWS